MGLTFQMKDVHKQVQVDNSIELIQIMLNSLTGMKQKPKSSTMQSIQDDISLSMKL